MSYATTASRKRRRDPPPPLGEDLARHWSGQPLLTRPDTDREKSCVPNAVSGSPETDGTT
ncbi:hypothetical protein KPSA3_05228 [Pseudomonas syringae pv. actinidiae]|uniref:Uncharacterized protein n=1 Tax=Pseudomonas syringae pv. actinidiae TaxID=103796 RepID=A0AAN4Q8E9_PSESF|nr:hypothetical protein KPSA3_05228 [Pseudomonas syringae pv. actinidiae]